MEIIHCNKCNKDFKFNRNESTIQYMINDMYYSNSPIIYLARCPYCNNIIEIFPDEFENYLKEKYEKKN